MFYAEWWRAASVFSPIYRIFRKGLWRKANWDWCGTGKADYSILPGQSVQLTVRFSDEERGERMLGNFIEAGTNRCGLIVLATETSPDA